MPARKPAAGNYAAATVSARSRIRSRSPSSGLARVALASVLFGFSGVFIRLSYDHGANVPAVLTVRSLTLLPWLAVLAFAKRRAQVRAAWPQLLWLGLLQTVNVVTFYSAVSRMSPALVSLIFYTYPAVVVVGAHVLGWNRLDGLIASAVGATLLGVVLTIGLPDSGVDALGVALAMLNAAGYAVYILSAQAALRRTDPVTIIGSAGSLSALLLLAGSLGWGINLPSSSAGIGSLAVLAVVIMFPHALMLSGVGRLGGAWGSLVSCLEVITTVVATALLLGLPLGQGAIVGGILIVIGGVAAPIVAAQRRRPGGVPAPAERGP